MQDSGELIGDDGILKQRSPKAENGLYFAGLYGRGIFGSGMDAESIAGDIDQQAAAARAVPSCNTAPSRQSTWGRRTVRDGSVSPAP